MPSNPFKLPGSDLLRIGDSFLPGGRNSDKHAPPPKPKDTGVGQGGGGGRRKPAEAPPSSDLEAMDMTTEPAPEEHKAAEPEAKLFDAAWTNPETLFLEESEVTCKLTSPPGKEHLTRVEAKLFAKRAKGPELITKVDGNADESGVVISIFSSQSGKGHIVRLQSVEDG